jgi:tetratricopeptide (TPR) repeat protein
MDLLDVIEGRCDWLEYVRNQSQLGALEEAVRLASTGTPGKDHAGGRSVSVLLPEREYATAIQSGLGALGELPPDAGCESRIRLDLGMERLAGGIDRLSADFNLALGDLIWKLEMRNETLENLLTEIRLAEFEREARAYRRRAERGYLNGWYEEALRDFLEAERRNYPDFAVHRSIASIYLYHLVDLPAALEYFRKAVKYARPSDARQSAEASYFAGIVCAIERRLDEAAQHLDQAIGLNAEFSEAFYQRAWVAALLGDRASVTSNLEAAINGDSRYHERAKTERAFEPMRAEVDSLLDRMMEPVRERLLAAKRGLGPKEGHFTARVEEERLTRLLREIEDRMAETGTYKGGLEFMNALARYEDQVRNLYDLFRKRYQINLNEYVRSVAFSPDGKYLAAGLLNGEVKFWEVCGGLSVMSLSGHVASVNSVVFSPDGQWLASGSRDKTIKIWDAESGGEFQNLTGHAAEVRSVAFSPDGNWLISGSHDRTVRMWRVLTGRPVQVLAEHKHFVTSVAFSPNGSWIASASLDKTIRIWDPTTGTAVRTLTGHARGVESLTFSPDGRLLASGGNDRLVKIWDLREGKSRTLGALSSDVTSLAFSPDGKLLAAGCLGKTMRVWRLAEGELVETVRVPQISYNSVAFSPEGEWLALASRDIQLWLKVVLPDEAYEAVQAGEMRATAMRGEVSESGVRY